MDVKCPICAEPWDVDSLHDIDKPFKTAYADFRRFGCEAFGEAHNGTGDEYNAARWEIYDLLGDDIDGAAALLEDFGL